MKRVAKMFVTREWFQDFLIGKIKQQGTFRKWRLERGMDQAIEGMEYPLNFSVIAFEINLFRNVVGVLVESDDFPEVHENGDVPTLEIEFDFEGL